MLPPLHDDDRPALVRLATMLIAGALCVLPLTTQSSPVAGAAGVRDVADDANLTPPARLTFPVYEIDRDPFVPQGAVRAKLEGGAVPMTVGQGTNIGIVLPPNVGAGLGAVVRAIVLGDPPRALIEVGGTVRVVGVGDRLGALTVAGITEGRVALSDGSALILDGNRK